jgi:hypothetical protein
MFSLQLTLPAGYVFRKSFYVLNHYMLVTRCQTTRELKKLYEEQGVSKFYKKPPEQQDDERFYLQVTNPDTGTFYKLSDLPVAYRKFGEERTYPIRQVNQIIRIKRLMVPSG